jgi:hypothetical protein
MFNVSIPNANLKDLVPHFSYIGGRERERGRERREGIPSQQDEFTSNILLKKIFDVDSPLVKNFPEKEPDLHERRWQTRDSTARFPLFSQD